MVRMIGALSEMRSWKDTITTNGDIEEVSLWHILISLRRAAKVQL